MLRRLFAATVLVLFSMPALAAVTGSVMSTEGAPVAGARVSIYAPELPEARRARLVSESPERVPLESTQTDAKGAFSLPSPKDAIVDLHVEASGYEPSSRRIERDEESVVIALTKRDMLKGAVTAGGKAVPNATVVISYEGTDYVTRTDEQGRYSAPEVRRARTITVLHPGYANDNETFERASTPASELNRTLTAGTKLSGRVVAADGTTPVANATILVDQWPLATSGDDGTFTIARMPARWSTLAARKDSLIAQRSYDSAKGAPLTLKMEKAAIVSGRVTDVKTKLPVAGAFVSLNSNRRFMLFEAANLGTYTDAKGAYSIAAPAAAYSINVSHPAFDLGSSEATVTAGQHAVKDVSVAQLARISGVVIDDSQKPVVAANVSAEPAGDPNPMRSFMRPFRQTSRTVSGPDGRFSIRVSGDRDLRLYGNKRGLPIGKGETLNLAPAERKSGVVLVIPSGIAVSGIVTDPNGDPLPGVTVAASETPQGRGGMMVRQFVISAGMGEEEDMVTTGKDGRFTLRVQEGTYEFTFRREGYAPKTVRAQTVTAQGAPLIEARLDPAAEITGRVTRGGVGVADVNIATFGEAGSISAVTGPDGSFTLGGLAAGSTRLMLRKEEDFIQDQRTVTAPSRDVLFELPAGGRVTGRVVEKGSGKPITTFQAGISTSRGGGGFVMMAPPQLRSFNSDDGSFVLENVPAGPTSLVAQAPGFANGRLNINVEEGKTVSDVVVELETGVRLVGKVTGPNGSAVPDASIELQPSPSGQFARGGAMRRATTDANGEFTLDSLDPGEETFAVSHPKYLETLKTVTLKGRETRMDVQLSGGQRLTGVVVTDNGMPVADARVEAFSASGGGGSARTNASGQFEFPSLAPARYRFTASKSGHLDGVLEDVDTSSGGNLRIEMRTGGTIYGRVSGLSEQELAGATVTARAGRQTSSAAVDPQGNFRIEGAPTGTVQVSAATMTRGMMERRTSGTQAVELAAGGSQQVNLEFRSDTVVRGRVTRNGVPLGGATVMFQPRGGASRASASTSADEAGNYTVAGLEEGEYSVMVADSQRFNPYTTTFQVRAGASTFDIDYRIASVRGRVVDAGTNDPIENATISFRTSSETRVVRSAMTDPAGNFTMESVSPGPYTITVSAEGYGAEVREETFGESGRDGLELRLSRNDGVRLRVVDGRDQRQISAFIAVYDMAGRVVHDARGGGMFGSNPTGEVHLPLAAGQYTAALWTSGYAPMTVRLTSPSPGPQTVAMTPGGTISVQSRHSTVRRMRLLDAQGMPYPRMSWMPAARDLLPGTVPIENVAPGRYTLQLLNADESVADTVSVEVREGETVGVSL